MNTLKMSNDEYIKNNTYFLMGGYNALKTNLNKNFITMVGNLSKNYYREKKQIVKKKHDKLLPNQN